jgi:hypothetical protein
MEDVIPREITNKDWQQVETKIKQEWSRRQNDEFRKQHETVWKEVDRQVNMKSPESRKRSDTDWHSAIELGELAKASEILGADVMRLAFPNTRAWFEPHIELPPKLDENGNNSTPSQKEQIFYDGALRALMSQQHQDFGFKSRFSLSVKEALHHGSFVAEARGEDAMLFDQTGGIASIHAPVWVPHSMWNCWPDPSPSVIGSNMFYTGSMIIREYMPLWKLKAIAEKGIERGWMPSQLKKVKKKSHKDKDVETDDVELIKYYGDCVIDKKDGSDIFLPNSKVILANGTIVFYAPNELPFPNILYNGYERLDVRDPYYTSPLIKLAPMNKLATTLANKVVDITSLHGEPPCVYDANDPQMVANGGPIIAPSAMTGTKYFGKGVQPIPIGDPTPVINALQLSFDQLRSGTSVDSIRAGGDGGDATATEIRARAARGEVRVVDFVDKLEYSLRTFLYMQHEINKREMESYSFYNPEMDAPDFMRVSKDILPQNVHFDVVGARGVLGEEERSQKMTAVVAYASGNPMFAPLLKSADILKEMLQDAGVKNPERFLNIPDDETQQIEQQIEQKYQAVIEEGQKTIFDLEKKLAITQAVNDAKVSEAITHANIKGETSRDMAAITAQLESVKTGLKVAEAQAKNQPQAQQVSIAEISALIKNVEKVMDKAEKEDEKEDKATEKKLEAMMSAIEKMGQAVAKLGKPRRIKRDSKGNAVGVEIEE